MFCSKISSKEFTNLDWSETGYMSALYSLNAIRVPWIVRELNSDLKTFSGKPLEGFKLLDVGCGAGILSLALAELGASVIGIDESETALNAAKQRANIKCPQLYNKALQFISSPLDEFEFNHPDKFDAVIASEVIEHVDNVPEFVFSCTKLTKVGGLVFFTTINRTVLSAILAKYLAEYVLRVVPPGIHSYDKFVTPKELKTYLLSYSINDIKTNGLFFNPFSNTWKWTNNLCMNFSMCGRKTDDQPVYNPDAFSHVL